MNFNILTFITSIIIIYFYMNIYQNVGLHLYINEIKLIKWNLIKDFHIYQKCIRRTNKINCGRSTSKVKKKNKIMKKNILFFDEPKNSISTDLKKCDNINIIFAIQTGTDYFAERYIYRQLYSKYNNILFFFFSGLSINKTINRMIKTENDLFKDIVIFPFISTYYTLSLSFVSEIKWVKNRCKNYKWLIRHQADVYVNVDKIFGFMKNINCSECCIGEVKINSHIVRSKSKTFYLPKYLLPNSDVYPKYLHGPIIIFTYRSTEILYGLIGKVFPQYWVDDVYIGLLLNHTNISLVDFKYFSYYSGISLTQAKKMYAIHNLFPSELYYLIATCTIV